MSRPPSSRPSASSIVVALGLVSAIALVAASLADFGDPYEAARVRAEQAVRARAVEVRLAWDEMQTAEAPPPGARRVFVAGPPPEQAPTSPPPRSDQEQTDPLTGIYFRVGHEALDAGDASRSFEAFSEGLRLAQRGSAGRAEALYGAVRAANALGRTSDVRDLRSQLFSDAIDSVLDGTSAKLLSCLIPPCDGDAAFALLAEGSSALPPPDDELVPTADGFAVQLDPWWSALQRRLQASSPDLDWDVAFSVGTRVRSAAGRFVDESAILPVERWVISLAGGQPVAHRAKEGQVQVASMDETAFASALTETSGGDEMKLTVGRHSTGSVAMTRLEGTPFSFRVEHLNPLGDAAPEARRVQLLRWGLIALALLVLLASIFSSRAMARARRLAALRSTFVASVSHDLRTPTQAILLLAETLEKKLVTDPDGQGRYHVQIRREAQRLRRLVEDLLDGARIDRGGGARIERKKVDTRAFFDELLLAMEERASMAGATFGIQRGELPKTILVDPDGLHRALWNLLENAIHYGHAEGEPAAIEVTVRAEGDLLCVDVADEGPGIPPRYNESVFEAFERLEALRTADGIDKDTGTGLGLAIVRALSVAHGGSARVVPTPKGARLAVTFRITEPEEPVEDIAA